MSNAIIDLLDLFDDREPSGSLAIAIDILGRKQVRVISMNLFSWLQRQRRFGHDKPLELRKQYDWCQELPRMLEKWPSLNQLFVIESDTLRFRNDVSDDERERIRSLVQERYKPALRT